MKSDITNENPDYTAFKRRWKTMGHVLDGEDTVKEQGTEYLPKTNGMEANDPKEISYKKYKYRARLPEITSQALTAISGLVFEKDPLGVSDDVITNTNQNNYELARDVIRAVSGYGRDVLVIDAPSGGGEPFIARYSAVNMPLWKTSSGNPSELEIAVFTEQAPKDNGLYTFETETIYRQYLRKMSGAIEVAKFKMVDDEMVLVDDPVDLPVRFMPIVTVGSIDLTPQCDPIPLMPVARCALAYYRKSADYEDALHRSGQPTPWVKGITQDQYDLILQQGIGSSSLWYLGDQDGQAGFLESHMLGQEHRAAMQEELAQAESYAVRLTRKDGQAESGLALQKRAAAQHASIYTMANAVSLGISAAQRMRALWAGQSEPEDFVLDATIDEQYAGEQIINALNAAVNSGNAPRSALFEAIRKAGLSELSNEDMQSEIDTLIASVDVGSVANGSS